MTAGACSAPASPRPTSACSSSSPSRPSCGAPCPMASMSSGLPSRHRRRSPRCSSPSPSRASSTVINALIGTAIAWVLVRDDFAGKPFVNALIDLPFALPTIVAGLTLLALYGPRSPFGINAAYSQVGIMLALLFITLPFVVRAVQPVLEELDREMEEAAASLGASSPTVLRRDRPAQPPAGHPDRLRARVRALHRRVRLRHPHRRQHPLPHGDGLGLHLRPGGGRQAGLGLGGVRRAARGLPGRAGRLRPPASAHLAPRGGAA